MIPARLLPMLFDDRPTLFAIVPTSPGLEFALSRKSRPHYALPGGRPHFIMPEGRAHYALSGRPEFVMPERKIHFIIPAED